MWLLVIQITVMILPPLSTLAGDQIHRSCSVAEALQAAFDAQPLLRGYVLDDQGAVRRHVVVFVDGVAVVDRERLSDAVQPGSEIFVMQALSGG